MTHLKCLFNPVSSLPLLSPQINSEFVSSTETSFVFSTETGGMISVKTVQESKLSSMILKISELSCSVRYMVNPSMMNSISSLASISLAHFGSIAEYASVVTLSVSGRYSSLNLAEFSKSTLYHLILPLSNLLKRVSIPEAIFTIVQSGCLLMYSLTMLSRTIVLPITPICIILSFSAIVKS